LVRKSESSYGLKGDDVAVAWVGPMGQWLVVALVFLSAIAYFAMSHGIRNYLSFLRESVQKVLGALGAGL
jgi:hypothetical protein